MADPKQSVTYLEDSDVLAWIEQIRSGVSWHRGRTVQRSEVLRWLTRRAKAECPALSGLAIESISSQI